MAKKKWDRGLDFKQALEKLLAYKKWVRAAPKMTGLRRISLRNVNILILALLNGLRISEAIECYYKWLEDPQQEIFNVRVAKSRRDRYRLCIVKGLDSIDHKLTKHLEKPKPNNLQSWSLIRFGFNTHSLRYAFINHMLSQGYDPATVSLIIGHSKLETLLSYIQEKRAREALLEEARRALKELPQA
jgi:cobalamin biosynthesis Co2+ chelatase CbiK